MEATEGVKNKRDEPGISFSCPSGVLVDFDVGAIVESRRDVGEGVFDPEEKARGQNPGRSRYHMFVGIFES